MDTIGGVLISTARSGLNRLGATPVAFVGFPRV